MILAALLLLAVGTADLFRPRRGLTRIREAVPMVLVGSSVVALCIWGLGADFWWLLAATEAAVTWLVLTPGPAYLPKLYPWPLVGLALLIVACIASDPYIPPPNGWLVRWYEDLDLRVLKSVSLEHFLLGLSYVVFLVESANVVVRMVLAGLGSQVLDSERELKGGRALGPLERIFVFAMALAGQYLAVGAVVAAKGILRFPEITGKEQGTKAEYVLVGSFVSWGLALLLVPLLVP